MTRTIFIAAALALAVTLPDVSAHAQASRTFVSAAGSDSNNCANVATPCRHFAAAFAATAPSGEIFVLDPANYGSVTITHAVAIEGHGWASVAPPSNGYAFTINAGPSDSISIHGVAINGTGATGGTNGIVFNSGAKLAVIDCTITYYSQHGILVDTAVSTEVLISHTLVSENQGGIVLSTENSATISATLNQVTLDNNTDSIELVANGGQIEANITNSQIGNNREIGLYSIGSGNFSANQITLKNVTFSTMQNDIFLAGDNVVSLSQVTQHASSFINLLNAGVICTGSGNDVLSDGTNHLLPIAQACIQGPYTSN